jgi:lysophospholipase L1-like esterase
VRTRPVLVAVAALVAVAVVVLASLWAADLVGPQEQSVEKPVTFGDLMKPAKTDVIPPAEATATFRDRAPRWGELREIRWYVPNAFTFSLTPKAFGSHVDGDDKPRVNFSAAEFFLNNEVAKNADVTFTATGRRFAIHYMTTRRSDAMVWLDGRPVATKPFTGVGSRRGSVHHWIEITLPASRAVKVRFAGPFVFCGVDHPADETLKVTATPPPFTIGVVSDSMYETSLDPGSMSSSAAPTLSTMTGFRVWNMAQGGTGYLNTGADPAIGQEFNLSGTTRFGSNERVEALATAPIDALLVNGSLNDGPPFSVAAHLDAVDRFLRAVEMRLPSLPIVLVGLEPMSTSKIPDAPTKHYLAMTRALKSMATEHDNVVGFIDPYTPNWFTGTGSSGRPRGDGNQDQYIGRDGLHPNGAGQVFFQKHVVDQLRTLPVDPRDRR